MLTFTIGSLPHSLENQFLRNQTVLKLVYTVGGALRGEEGEDVLLFFRKSNFVPRSHLNLPVKVSHLKIIIADIITKLLF